MNMTMSDFTLNFRPALGLGLEGAGLGLDLVKAVLILLQPLQISSQ